MRYKSERLWHLSSSDTQLVYVYDAEHLLFSLMFARFVPSNAPVNSYYTD